MTVTSSLEERIEAFMAMSIAYLSYDHHSDFSLTEEIANLVSDTGHQDVNRVSRDDSH
jgi:hypothetical protein